jgi:hypothetical protein
MVAAVDYSIVTIALLFAAVLHGRRFAFFRACSDCIAALPLSYFLSARISPQRDTCISRASDGVFWLLIF